MLFPTLEFAVFFTVVFLVSWWLWRRATGRKLFLAAASFFFYGWWNWRYTFLLFGCCLLAFLSGSAIQSEERPSHRKSLLVGSITIMLSALIVFKYLGLLTYSFHGLAMFLGLRMSVPLVEALLPVGISFFTFQAISYVIDVYRRSVAASRSLLDVTLYLSFFPQLVAGPIVRGGTMLPQIASLPDPESIPASRAFLLIMGGLVKKVLFASYLATELVDPVFETPGAYSGLHLLVATYGYAIQIFCDFSAYSDMAIGFAMLLGFRFPENFRDPYRAASLAEFWQRWHISLSTWLRDYLFLPMAYFTVRKFSDIRFFRSDPRNLAYVVAMMTTMLLGGLWHGAQYTFLVWGGLHGLGLAFERLTTPLIGKRFRKRPLARIFSTVAVFHYVCFAWVVFRSQSMGDAAFFINRIFSAFSGTFTIAPFVAMLLLLGIAMHHIPVRFKERLSNSFALLPSPLMGLIVGVILLIVSALSPQGVAPFIYFRF